MPNSVLQYYGGAEIMSSTVLVDGITYTLAITNLPFQIVTHLSTDSALVKPQAGEGQTLSYSIDYNVSQGFIYNPVLYLGEGGAESKQATSIQGLELSTSEVSLPSKVLTSVSGLKWPWIQPIAYRGKRDSATLLANFQAFQQIFAQYAQIFSTLTIATTGLLPTDDTLAKIGYARRITAFQSQLRRQDPILLGWY